MTTKISLDNIQLATLQAIATIPKITSVSYPNGATAANPAGGETITITGAGFVAGATVLVDGVSVGAVTVASSTSLSFTSPAKAVGSSYVLYIINADGGTAILYPGLSYSGVPAWVNASGTIGSNYENTVVSRSVMATGDGTISYSIVSGSLPSGVTFNGSTGALSGTAPADSGSTTYTFTVRATDAQGQTTDRVFSLTINTDTITWSTPATDGSTYSIYQYDSITYPLVATSAAGSNISYTANALPTGMTLASGVISGSPTVLGANVTLLTANATATSRTSTRTITWSISVAGDIYWPTVTLLLNGEASGDGSVFVTDASTTSANLTIVGDTRPDNRTPFVEGYYSCYFDGSGDYISIPNNAATNIGTGAFTIEYWVWVATTQVFTNPRMFGNANWNDAVGIDCAIEGGSVQFRSGGGVSKGFTFGTSEYGAWHHFAFSRTGGVFRAFKDGVLINSYTESTNLTSANPFYVGTSVTNEQFAGYISNFRLVNGVGLYTTTFTPPTGPLYNINGTGALLCQSSQLVDNGPSRFAVTKTGDTKVDSFVPFGRTYTASPVTSYSTFFDGTGDYLSLSTNAAFAYGTGNYTIESWIYPSVISSAEIPVYKQHNSGAAAGDTVEIRISSSKIYGYIENTSFGGTTTLSSSTWYHVAYVRSGNTYTLYLNGVSEGTTTNSLNISTNPTTVRIGTNQAASAVYTGYISNFRIVKGQALYTTNFTPATSALTTTSQGATAGNVSLLTCQDTIVVDRSSNTFAITRNGDAVASKFHPFSANGYITTTTVPSTYSTYFDGTGDYVTFSSLANSQTAFGSSTAFTAEAWVFPMASTWVLIGNLDTGAGNIWWTIEYSSGMVFTVGNWGVSSANASTTATIAQNVWTHVVVQRRTDNTVDIYYNGVAQTVSNSFYGGYVGYNLTAGTIAQIGANGYVTAGAMYIHSLRFTKSRVYTGNFAPSTTPLTAISGTSLLTCQNSTIIDNSTNAFTLVVGGDAKPVKNNVPFHPTTGLDTSYYGSTYFDGAGDYLTIPASAAFSPGTGTFTVEFWYYPTASLTNAGIFDTRTSSTSTAGILIRQGDVASNGLAVAAYMNNATAIYGGTNLVLNSWNHVAVVRNASNLITVYVNGIAGTATSITNNLTDGTSNTPYIGRFVDNSASPNATLGYLSNFRMVVGTAVYTSTFAPPVQQLTAVTNTTLLTLRNNKAVKNQTFLDYSTYNAVVSSSASAYQSNFSPYAVNWSVYFDGNGDYLTVPYNASLTFGSGNFTFECWIYPNRAASTSAMIAGIWDGASTTPQSWYIYINTSGNLVFLIDVATTDTTIFTSSSTITNSTWQHVAVTRSSNSWYMFVNGAVVGTATNSSAMSAGTAPLYIGSYQNKVAGDTSFLGYISNLRIVKGTALYTAAFTPSTSKLYPVANTSLLVCHSRTVNDFSPNYYDVTVVGDTFTSNFSPFLNYAVTPISYATQFDGTGDYLTVPQGSAAQTVLSGGDFTIECWIYLTAVPASHGPVISSTVNSDGFVLRISSTPTVNWVIPGVAAYSFGPTLSTNTWYHIAVCRVSTTVTGYVNGTQYTFSSTNRTANASTTLQIGTDISQSTYFTGYISNLRVVTGIALYTTTFTPSTTALTAVDGTQLLTCQSIYTIDSSKNAFTVTAAGDARPREWNPFGWTTALQQTTYSPDTIGGSFKFSGAQNISVPGAFNSIFRNGSDWTIEWWQWSQTLGGHAIGTHSSGISASTIITHDPSGKVFIYMNGVTGTNVTWPSTKLAPARSWNHFAITKASTTITFWYDGGNMGSTSTGATEGTDGSGYSWRLGSEDRGLSYIDGYIADHRITKGTALYKAAFVPPTAPLQPTTHTALLIKATPQMVNYAMTSNILSVGDVRLATAARKYGSNSYYFDGNGDYLQIVQNGIGFTPTTTTPFTIEAWVYMTAAGGCLFSNEISGPVQVCVGFSVGTLGFNDTNANQTGGRYVVFGNYTGSAWNQVVSSSQLTLNTWTHIACVFTGSASKIFVDGVDVTVGTVATWITSQGTVNYFVGRRWDTAAAPYFTGYIDDFRLSRGIARYTTAFTPPTSTFFTK